jgi:MraZ protein
MFFGKYKHTIDSKGRVIVPSDLREATGQKIEKYGKGPTFYVMPGPGGCVHLFEEDQFADIVKKQFDLGLVALQKESELLRKFSSFGARRVCDSQGRIQIPEELVKYAGLKKDVVFLGLINRIELWDSETFDRRVSLSLVDFERLAEELAKEKREQQREGV